MEHRGMRYTIRAGIERNMWSVAIHPDGTEPRARLIYGTREDAEFEARSMIDRWTQGKPILLPVGGRRWICHCQTRRRPLRVITR
jgi:hypothetical protein